MFYKLLYSFQIKGTGCIRNRLSNHCRVFQSFEFLRPFRKEYKVRRIRSFHVQFPSSFYVLFRMSWSIFFICSIKPTRIKPRPFWKRFLLLFIIFKNVVSSERTPTDTCVHKAWREWWITTTRWTTARRQRPNSTPPQRPPRGMQVLPSTSALGTGTFLFELPR